MMSLIKKLFVHDTFMFGTHTFGEWCGVGTIHEIDDVKFVVTKIRRSTPTELYDGGSAAHWEVYGEEIK